LSAKDLLARRTLRWGSLHVGYLWPGSENTGLL